MAKQKADAKGRIVVSNRVNPELWRTFTSISRRRKENIADTLSKALAQYISADARKRR